VTWRKYVVRGLVFSVLGAFAAAGWLYQRLTAPDAVRQQVAAKLESHFLATSVRLDSASLRLLGGISFGELRLVRQNDPEQNDLLYVPAGIIYHDKEQLLDGKLAIRKLELHRPRWHFIRQRDGTWNSAGLLGPVDLNETLPTIVIRHGTILIEDRLAAPDAAPIEFRDVNLTLINDPRPTLTLQLKGESDLTGALAARAVLDRATEAVNLRLEAPALPIGPALAARLAGYCAGAEHARHVEGVARIEADLVFDPLADNPWAHRISAVLSAGKVHHPALPIDLDHVEASLRCQDEWLRLDALQARAGPARVKLTGLTMHCLCPDGDLDLDKLTVTDLPVTPELFARLPAGMRKFQADYAPAGKVNLEMETRRRDGKWERQSVLSTTAMSAAFAKFPYPLTHLQGRITEQLDQARRIEVHRIDLVGAGSGGRPVHIQGVVAGEAPHAAVHLDIWGDNAPIDETLLAALPTQQQKLARAFHPTAGKVDFVVQVRRGEGETEFANRFTVRIHDAVACYDQFRYPLENVSGVLEVYPHHFEFRDFRGGHKGGEFVTSGRSHPSPGPGEPERVSIRIQGKNILLDDELAAALAPKLQETWTALQPTGRVSFETQIEQIADRPDDMTVTLTAAGCTLRPAFLPYLLNDVSGTVRYGRGKVDVTNLAGRHGPTVIALGKCEIHLKPTGGFWARLADLQGRPLVLDADFRAALPPPLRKVCELLAPDTPVGLGVELVIDMPSEPNVPPDVYWDGGIALQDATLNAGVDIEKVRGQLWCQGRHDGRQLKGVKGNLLLDEAQLFRQPFRAVHSHILISPDAPDVLRLPDLKASIFGGDVGGEVRVEFGPTIHYDVNLTALQVRLEEIGQHNLGAKEEWKGLASARLFLSGHGKDIHGLEGSGQVDVPRGQMYNLPLLLDLIKVLGLRTPDRTAFEEAHASFSIKGPRLYVSRLDLDGNAISLSGQGEMNLDGTDLQLDFYAVWGRIKQMLPPIVREIPPALGQQLLKIKMRGSMQDVKIDQEPVPALVEPLERLLKRFTARGGEARK